MFTIGGVEVTEDIYRADESITWIVRALKECLSRRVDIVATEPDSITRLFTLVDQLPEERQKDWLAEIDAAGIVR